MNTLSITRLLTYSLFAASISLLAACSSGDDGPAAANPTGYYTGTAAVMDGPVPATANTVNISDLQGLVDGNRFMAMSDEYELLYDGTITSISGNSFSATVKVYKDGAFVSESPTSFTGTITQGAKITGTFSGTGTWNGEFTLVYSLSNSQAATSAQVATATNQFWGGDPTLAFEDDTDTQFEVDIDGVITGTNSMGGGVLSNCFTRNGGSITPVASTRLYRIAVVYENCADGNATNGNYTGLATTKDSDGKLVWMITKSDTTNGAFANASDYIRRTVVN